MVQVGSNVNFGEIIKYNTSLKRMIINLPWSYIHLCELILAPALVKLDKSIFEGRFSSVLNEYISFCLECCISFCISNFINQGTDSPDEVHIFFDRKYKDYFSFLQKGNSQKKIIPNDWTFLFQFQLPFLFTVQTRDKTFAWSFDWLHFYIRVSYEFNFSLARVWKRRFFTARKGISNRYHLKYLCCKCLSALLQTTMPRVTL